ncbi:MAG: hypothetical protein IJ364_06960 [Oscillospiraceae bacterium]|nr:hypothetical protein [Oscillospiraceae bacterium]
MTGKYDDIIYLAHPRSPDRPPMNALDRAAQFSPFAALTGYDAIIAENGRYTDTMAILDENVIDALNEKLLKLQAMTLPRVKITYFRPDTRKAGGAYIQLQGRLKKIDSFEHCIVMEDKNKIPIDSIFDIESEDVNL